MTWTRLDDNWMADEAFDGLTIYDRWHYLAMIQFCSRGKRYTGVMPLIEAETCSTAPEKASILAKLIDAKLVKKLDEHRVQVLRIEDHVPPPSVREASAATAIRVARHRKHKNADHSDCLPGRCPQVPGNADTEPSNALHQDKDSDGKGQAVTGSTTPLRPDEEAMLSELDEDQLLLDDADRFAHLDEAS